MNLVTWCCFLGHCVVAWLCVGDGVVEWVTCDFAGFGGGCVELGMLWRG